MDKLNPFDGFAFNTFEDVMKYQGISPLFANYLIEKKDPTLLNAKPDPVIIRGKKEKFYFIPFITIVKHTCKCLWICRFW